MPLRYVNALVHAFIILLGTKLVNNYYLKNLKCVKIDIIGL